MAWASLVLAGLFEMFGVLMINKLRRDRSLRSFVLLALGFGASFFFLSIALESLPMGTAYAIWTGIGAAGGALLGMIFYGEPTSGRRIFFLALIIGSAIGLKLIS